MLKKILLITFGLLIIVATSAFIYNKLNQKTIVILLLDDFTMLDVVGAYQTFPGLYQDGYRMKFVAKEKGLVKSSHIQSLNAEYSLSEISSADILYIPNVENISDIEKDQEIIDWIIKIDENSQYTIGVGSGSVLLTKAGCLKGKKTSTQWYNKEKVESLGATFIKANYVRDGKYYSGIGASASIDMVLDLISNVSGEQQAKTMQLFIEYDPNPPINSGMFNEADSIVKSIADELVNNQYLNSSRKEEKTIAMFLYEGFTMLDIIGPYQVFKELAPLGYRMKFVGKKGGLVPSDMMLTMDAEYSIDEIQEADILFIPGGSSTADAMKDVEIINWIKQIDKNTTYSTSVCTGSLLYAKAGLLGNKNASTHWYTGKFLTDYGANYTHQRYTVDGKYMTGAGVSSGIDLGLLIVKEMVSEDYAKAIQLKIGYHPNPPFNAGSPEKSDQQSVEWLSQMYKGIDKKYKEAKER